MRKQHDSQRVASICETVAGLYASGLMDNRTMREFEESITGMGHGAGEAVFALESVVKTDSMCSGSPVDSRLWALPRMASLMETSGRQAIDNQLEQTIS